MRRLLPIPIWLGVVGLAAVALARVGEDPAARATAIAASGSFELSNSRDGLPIFAATGIAPGEAVAGRVTIEDTGTAAAALVLRRAELVDVPGLGGGLLSDRLRLSVVDVTVPTAPRPVYAGPLASMPDQSAGDLEAGEARTFEFTARLPASGAPSLQNAVQGAATTVAYSWLAEEPTAGGAAPPTPSPPSGAEAGPQGAGTGDQGGVTDEEPALRLTVPRVRRAPRSAKLVAWAVCDRSCRLVVRGRLRATSAGAHRGARIRFAEKGFHAAGAKRLCIPIPRGLRRFLRRAPAPLRLRARLRFVAIGADGRRAAVRKTVRLRARRPNLRRAHRRGSHRGRAGGKTRKMLNLVVNRISVLE